MKRAFTLIELLTALGIIALLTAVLVPVFFLARGKARDSTCISNLQQIGAAVALYAQDNDQQFPYGNDPTDSNTNIWQLGTGEFWPLAHNLPPLTQVLSPYIKDKEVWHCPADTGYDAIDTYSFYPLNARPTSYDAFGTSYDYHTLLALEHKTIAGVAGYDSNTPPGEHGPAEIPMIFDGYGHWHASGDYLDLASGRYNVLHVDGHVKQLTTQTLIDEESYSLDPP
jgi:general secretion pathway protein G